MGVSGMRIQQLLIISAILIISGCFRHGSQPVTPNPLQNPIAIAKADQNPRAIITPVSFSGSDSYDPDGGAIQLFEWDWNNDGTYDETGENVNHSWNVLGTFHVQLRVTDDEGMTDTLDDPLQIVIPGSDAGNLIWAKHAGGLDKTRCYGITVLSDNSVVVTGKFEGTATFGLGETNETQLVAAGWNDVFLARYSADGSLVWAKRAGGSNSDSSGIGITVLSDNSIVVIGKFDGTIIFGSGEANETQLASSGGYDIFMARYYSDGSLAWAESAGGSDWDSGQGIASLSDNSIVVTGSFRTTATFGSGESNETQLDTVGFNDIFIAQYNADGILQWARHAGSISNDQGSGITTLSDNSTIVTGSYQGTAIFGPGEPSAVHLISGGNLDIFIARYNSDGSFVWANSAGGSDEDGGLGITTLSDNSSVVTGYFMKTAVFGPGESNETQLVSPGNFRDSFFARYNADGSLAWAKCAVGSSADWANGITSLSDDSTIVTGHFETPLTFGHGEPNETHLVSEGNLDIFIARINFDGSLVWAKRAGGLGFDYGVGITALSDDTIAATGYFNKAATFGPGEPNETVLTSNGITDIFIARFMP